MLTNRLQQNWTPNENTFLLNTRGVRSICHLIATLTASLEIDQPYG